VIQLFYLSTDLFVHETKILALVQDERMRQVRKYEENDQKTEKTDLHDVHQINS
jgi:hypothetical protein